MDELFLKAFTEVIREQVSHGCDVEIAGVGVFISEHHKQYQQQYKDGRVVMMPPKDTIKFIAESTLTNDH